MEKLEFIQWAYVAIMAPLFGAIGGWLNSWWAKRMSAKRRKESIVSHLSGLPPESKAILIDFYQHGTHTRRADPSSPAVRVLVNSGLLARGVGGGTYDAVDSYLTVNPDIWEMMDHWMLKDARSISIVKEKFFEPVNHSCSD